MNYGSDNEINAMGTLTGKILLVLYPQLKCYEEGCYIINEGSDAFCIVISVELADGLCFAFEFKCFFPDKKYTTDIRYSIRSQSIMFPSY